jgi:hypothetical protein
VQALLSTGSIRRTQIALQISLKIVVSTD